MNNDNPGDDRRRFERIPFESEVELVQGTKLYRTRLKDISINGALIEEPEHWSDSKKTVEMRIHRTDQEPTREIRMVGQIVHETEENLGFECNSLSSYALAELKRLLELHLEPDQVQREIDEFTDLSPASA